MVTKKVSLDIWKLWKKILDNTESYRSRTGTEFFCIETNKLHELFEEEGLIKYL